MRLSLLSFMMVTTISLQAQSDRISSLPVGIYEVQQSNETKLAGNIILLDEGVYRLGSEANAGTFKFSATAQRVLFVTGPLKGIFARTVINSGAPCIILPFKENEELGFKLAQDILALYKKN